MGKGNIRNRPCPCGSGKKYKKCHYMKEWETIVARKKEVAEQIKQKILASVGNDPKKAGELLKKINL